jgi:hypothetical protein
VLHSVAASGDHTSACWLPAEAAGLSAEAERLREEVVRAERGEEAAEVAAAARAQLGGSEAAGHGPQTTVTAAGNEGGVA